MLSMFFIVFFPQGASVLLFQASATICSDFGPQELNMSLFSLFLHVCAMKLWNWLELCLFFDLYVPYQSHLQKYEIQKDKMVV